MPEEKFDDLIGVKCYKRTREALKRIARAKEMESEAELLRRAAVAIIECATLVGDRNVPLEMAIAQRLRDNNPLAAEMPASIGPEGKASLDPSRSSEMAGQAALDEALMQAYQLPREAPQGLPGSPPAAEEKRGRKSPRKRGPK